MIDRLWGFFCRLLLIGACALGACAVALLGWRYPPVAVLVLGVLTWRRLHGWRGSVWTHGTARFSSVLELARHGLLGDRGLILGRVCAEPPPAGQTLRMLHSLRISSSLACRLFLSRFVSRKWMSDRMVRLRKFVHLATFAPTGRGKGIFVILTNLLSWAGSVVCTDPKGENFKLSSEHRKKRLGHRIFRLDPFGLCGPGADTFNPLSTIDPNAADFLDQCRDVANMLVVRTGTEPDPHWNSAAEQVITAFLAFVCACEPNPAKRTLSTFRALVSSRPRFAKAVEIMQQTQGFKGVIQRLGHDMSWFQDKELGSVLTTVQRHTAFLDSPPVADSTGSSSFDPRVLKLTKATLYLVLPHDKLTTLAPLMRLWIGTTIRALARGPADESKTVLFLLDEAAHLGRCEVLEHAITLMRGMGIRLWFFFQSLGQLKDSYGEDKARVFLDNFDTQQFFGTNSVESAEAISQRLGECTVSTTTYGENTGWSQPSGVMKDTQGSTFSGGTNVSVSDMSRRLLRAEEILCLDEDIAVVTHRNLPPTLTRLVRYFDAPEFRRGGIGKSRGLGLRAAAAALVLLLVSAGFAGIAYILPPISVERPGAPRMADGFEPDNFPPDANVDFVSSVPPGNSQTSRRGVLIPIR